MSKQLKWWERLFKTAPKEEINEQHIENLIKEEVKKEDISNCGAKIEENEEVEESDEPKQQLALIFSVDDEENFNIECYVNNRIHPETVNNAILMFSLLLTDKFEHILENYMDIQSDEAVSFLELFMQARQIAAQQPFIHPMDVFNVRAGEE